MSTIFVWTLETMIDGIQSRLRDNSKVFCGKTIFKNGSGKTSMKSRNFTARGCVDRKIMLRWIKLPLGFQYVAVSLLFGGIFVLHVHEVIWIFVSWFPIFERCPWSCHMFQPIVAFERSFAKSLAIVLTNLQLVIINLMATKMTLLNQYLWKTFLSFSKPPLCYFPLHFRPITSKCSQYSRSTHPLKWSRKTKIFIFGSKIVINYSFANSAFPPCSTLALLWISFILQG